jgi:hypothetical protein
MKPGETTDLKLTIYANGYRINDGPFMDTAIPANKKFMD